MIQQEVMELIQRCLDDDLTEEEHEKLMEVLREDPESMALFERMKHLSDNLDQLPKVTPPYSIVDSIIPKLAQLEEQNEGQLQSTQPSPSNKHRSRLLWGWSSIIAAAIVVGIVITNGGLPLPNSDRASIQEVNDLSSSSSMGARLFVADESADSAGSGSLSAPTANEEVVISTSQAFESKESDMNISNGEEPELGIMNIDIEPYSEIILSPDERHTASIRQSAERIEVRIKNEQEDVVYAANETGHVEEFHWTDDSTHFIYTVNDGVELKTVEVKID